MEHLVGKVGFPVVDQGIDVPRLLFCLHHVRGVRVVCLHRSDLAGDAEVGAGLFARKLQGDLIIAGDVADVLVLKHLEPGAQANDDPAPDALAGLLEDAVGGLDRLDSRNGYRTGIVFSGKMCYTWFNKLTKKLGYGGVV